MASKAASDKDIILALGGPTAVAAALGYRVDAVKQWSSRSLIPWKARKSIERLAARKRKALPANFADERRVCA